MGFFLSTNPDDFHGLPDTYVIFMLRFPFDSPTVVSFNTNVTPPGDAPYLLLLRSMLSKIDREGGSVKPTEKGFLPRNLCREIQEEFLDIYDYLQVGPLSSEVMFKELHAIRIVAQMAGYLKKSQNKFCLTNRGKKVVEEGISGKEFLHFLKTYTLKFNWSYSDTYPEVDILQDTFLFTLFLLQLYGDEYKPSDFYPSLVLKAFPGLLDELLNHPFKIATPQITFECIYNLRMFNRFAVAFGFAELKEVRGEEPYIIKEFFRKKPFLDEFVKFSTEEEIYYH